MAKDIKNNKEIIELFKESLINVANVIGVQPNDVTRDEYIKYSIQHNMKRLNKVQINSIGGFKVAKNMFFQAPKETKEVKENNEYDMVTKLFTKYIKEYHRIPSFSDFEMFSGIKASVTKKYFQSTTELFNKVVEDLPEYQDQVFNETSFTKEYLKEVQSRVKKSKRFIITTAVSGKAVDGNFLKSLRNYADRNKAEILILPCEDVYNRHSECQWELDYRLRDCNVIYQDTYLNNNLYISSIKVSAKQILPLTGLDRFARKYGSMILASTKQFMKFVPKSNSRAPRAIMTTGAITIADYNNDRYMSGRISKIAEQDHIVGAIIVEIADDEIFHFRQVQASKSGSISDLGKEYCPDGTVKTLENIVAVFGDTHFGVHDEAVHEKLKEIVNKIDIEDIVLHDIFDGSSITHHDLGRPALKMAKALKGQSSLEQEGSGLAEYLDRLSSWIDGKLIIVPSNHNEFLERYLTEGRFINDAINGYVSLDLCARMIEGKDPLRYLIEEKIGIAKDTELLWLDRTDDYEMYGVEIGSHGDAGINGAKGSATSMEKAYGDCILGHAHTGQIFRGVYVVGTTSELLQGYNKKGASTWNHSICLLYPTGARQLINIIKNPKNGKLSWKL